MQLRRHAAAWKWIKCQIGAMMQSQKADKIQASRKFDPGPVNAMAHESLSKGSGKLFVLPARSSNEQPCHFDSLQCLCLITEADLPLRLT